MKWKILEWKTGKYVYSDQMLKKIIKKIAFYISL